MGMNFCTNCGAPLDAGQNFCRNCGFNIRGQTQAVESQSQPATSLVCGLGRNTLVWLTQAGLLGIKIHSSAGLVLAFMLPIPLLAAVRYGINAGAFAIYFTFWVAASLLLYDEFRWRGLQSIYGHKKQEIWAGKETWLVSWRSIRMADWNGRTLWFSSSDPIRKLSVTFNQKDSRLVEGTLTSWGVRYSWRPPKLPRILTQFSTLVVLMFIVSQAILVLAATLPFFPGEESSYATILNDTRSQIAGASFLGEFRAIFLNNVQVAWGGAVPFLGTLSLGFASYNTGRVIQAIAIDDKVPSAVVLALLYIFPHTWVEEFSYPIATAAGILAATKWRSVTPNEFSRRWKRGSTKFALALGGAALVLVVAGFIETLTTYLGYAGLVLWVPLAVAYYLFMMKIRKHKHSEYPTTGIP